MSSSEDYEPGSVRAVSIHSTRAKRAVVILTGIVVVGLIGLITFGAHQATTYRYVTPMTCYVNGLQIYKGTGRGLVLRPKTASPWIFVDDETGELIVRRICIRYESERVMHEDFQ